MLPLYLTLESKLRLLDSFVKYKVFSRWALSETEKFGDPLVKVEPGVEELTMLQKRSSLGEMLKKTLYQMFERRKTR